MNKTVTILLIMPVLLGGSLYFAYYYYFKKSLEIKIVQAEKEQEEIKPEEAKEEEENKEIIKPEEKEKKEENKVKSEEKQEEKEGEKEEITSIPWTYTWKGEILSLLLSSVVSYILVNFIIKENILKNKANIINEATERATKLLKTILEAKQKIVKVSNEDIQISNKVLNIFNISSKKDESPKDCIEKELRHFYTVFFVIAFGFLGFPFFFAFKKYKNKGYFRRFFSLITSLTKVIINLIICIIFLLIFAKEIKIHFGGDFFVLLPFYSDNFQNIIKKMKAKAGTDEEKN